MAYRTKECGAQKSVLTSLAKGLLNKSFQLNLHQQPMMRKTLALTDDGLKRENKKGSKNL